MKDEQTLPGADNDSYHNLLDLHQIEENFKIPKEKTKMGFGEIICSMTKSEGYSRRETHCN